MNSTILKNDTRNAAQFRVEFISYQVETFDMSLMTNEILVRTRTALDSNGNYMQASVTFEIHKYALNSIPGYS